LLVEASEAQAPALAASVAAAGLTPRVATDLELGATVVTGIRSSA
jgi:release factor glutamine methyltransferase